MKRRDILAKLRSAGLELEEGGRHTKVLRKGIYVSVVPRHNEIKDRLVRTIEKQTGVKLR